MSMPNRLAVLAATLLLAAAEPPTAAPEPEPVSEQAPEQVPVPSPRPENAPPPQTASPPAPDEPQAAPPPVTDKPEAVEACLSELKKAGAEFRRLEAIEGEDGCGIAAPLELSMVLPGVKLDPPGTMRCETALELVRWTRDMVIPAARVAAPGRSVTALGNASAYVCRARNNAETGKISEHARGNAVDIATISFSQGDPLTMKPRAEDSTLEGALQRTVTAAACLYFTTVLSPGSDATHQDHLHLDVLDRKGGYRYCR